MSESSTASPSPLSPSCPQLAPPSTSSPHGTDNQHERLNASPKGGHESRHPQKRRVVERGQRVADDRRREEAAEDADGGEDGRREEREAKVPLGEDGQDEKAGEGEDEAEEQDRPQDGELPDRVGVVQVLGGPEGRIEAGPTDDGVSARGLVCPPRRDGGRRRTHLGST